MSVSHRIYLVFLLLVLGWCLLIVTAPVLEVTGISAEMPNFIYKFFSRVCHQFDDRSFHLGGEKFAVCIRCFSIYFSFLFVFILYPFLHRLHQGKIPSPAFLLMAVIPMLLDVALSVSGLHFSTDWTRIVTGVFFGGALPFYIVSPLKEAALQVLFPRGGSVNARETE